MKIRFSRYGGNIRIQRTKCDIDGQEGSKPDWKLFVNNKPAESQDNEKVMNLSKKLLTCKLTQLGQTLILGMSVRKILSYFLELEKAKRSSIVCEIKWRRGLPYDH